MSDICAGCGSPITPGESSFYRKNPADDIGESFHARCGEKVESERLRSILVRVANDSRTWQLHEHTKELLRPFVVKPIQASSL